MGVIRAILMVLFVLVCIALTVVVLMQEGKSNGLGSGIGGMADSYWSKNKGRSMEGMLVKLTRIFVILFLVIAMVLNLGIW